MPDHDRSFAPPLPLLEGAGRRTATAQAAHCIEGRGADAEGQGWLFEHGSDDLIVGIVTQGARLWPCVPRGAARRAVRSILEVVSGPKVRGYGHAGMYTGDRSPDPVRNGRKVSGFVDFADAG